MSKHQVLNRQDVRDQKSKHSDKFCMCMTRIPLLFSLSNSNAKGYISTKVKFPAELRT